MELLSVILINTVEALLFVIEICMLVRALLSFLPIGEDNPFALFVGMVTEPVILPFRALFERMGWFQNTPIDVAFLVGCISLSFVSTLLTLLV